MTEVTLEEAVKHALESNALKEYMNEQSAKMLSTIGILRWQWISDIIAELGFTGTDERKLSPNVLRIMYEQAQYQD